MITLKDKLLLLLDSIALPYKAMLFLVENYSPETIINNIQLCEKDIRKNLGDAIFLKLKNAISNKNIENSASKLQKYSINPVFYYNHEYPESLKNISHFPLILYTKGNVELLNEKAIAIVGTRKPTSYGKEVTRHFTRVLSKAGLVTVSGLAYGLDMEVASETLEVKGKTIAVLGGGLDKIYPEQNTFLAEKIINNGGLLVSLYPPLKRPTKYSFVDRNRIVSGLSLGTVIIEAGESSGTLNTANHTIEQGRELFVVPANIFSKASQGSNRLIEELPETFTISPEHVLKVLNINYNDNIKITTYEEKNAGVSDTTKIILDLLYEGEKDFDFLQEKTKMDSKSLITLLTRLEISGLIKKLPNNFYSV